MSGPSPITLTFSGTGYFAPSNPLSINFLPGGGYTQGVNASGLAATQFGSPIIGLATQYISAYGASNDSYGNPDAVLKTRYLEAIQISSFVSGSPTIYNRNQYVGPSGSSLTQFGTFVALGGLQWAETYGISSQAFGTPWASFRLREITVAGNYSTKFGTSAIDKERALEPPGYDATQFGVTYVADNTIREYAQGFNDCSFGNATIWTRIQYVAPSANNNTLLAGQPEIRNNTRYVGVINEWTIYDGGVFGTFNYVDNRNRVITGYGLKSDKFGYVSASNKAVPVAPSGFDGTQPGTPMVAYKIRHLPIEGLDSLSVASWNQVRNAARVLAPTAISQLASGTPSVANRNRTVKAVSQYDESQYGTPFVAFRIRYLEQIFPPSPPWIPPPSVMLKRQYLLPDGIDGNANGVPFIFEHFTIIAPRMVDQQGFGEPQVRNKTPQLFTYGGDMAQFGNSPIRTRWRQFYATGDDMSGFGSATTISYRKKTLYVSGIHTLRMGATKVEKFGDDPPFQQYIIVDDGFNALTIPPHKTTQPVVYAEGIYGTAFGSTTRIQANSLFPQSIRPPLDQFGTASLSGGYQEISVDSLPTADFGKIRLSTNYIYAPNGEYPNNAGHEIDYELLSSSYGGVGWPFWGHVRVTHKNRTFEAEGFNAGKISNPTIGNKRALVSVSGIKSTKFGYPWLPFDGESMVDGTDFLDFGAAAVEHYIDPLIPRTVGMVGRDYLEVGDVRPELKNRALLPSGYTATQYGYQHIHPPVVVRPSGESSDAFGSGMIDFRIRYLHPEGIDTFECDYTFGRLSDRMRIKHGFGTSMANTIRPLYPAGTNASEFGAGRISERVRRIWPDQIRQDPPTASVSARSYINLPGYAFDACAFGDVQKWEAGKIKPQGWDNQSSGTGKTARTVRNGGTTGQLGEPNAARAIGPNGIGALGAGGATATDRFACGLRALPAVGFTGSQFGQAGVT